MKVDWGGTNTNRYPADTDVPAWTRSFHCVNNLAMAEYWPFRRSVYLGGSDYRNFYSGRYFSGLNITSDGILVPCYQKKKRKIVELLRKRA